jgi:hypothetical protein
MLNDKQKQIVTKIRTGEIDINNQESFFSALIKGLLIKLNEEIQIRQIGVPHFIVHTGSDIMYLSYKKQNMKIEPHEISNENYLYTIVPRCIVNLGGIDLVPDQLTNPYSTGKLQFETNEEILTLSAEFRRMPLKIGVSLKYLTDSYSDHLELIQQIITKLAFIKTFNITYMGQMITCSYKLPENFSEQHLTELDGMTQDNKNHVMDLEIEVETNLPIYSPKTTISSDCFSTTVSNNLHINPKM